jgi:predicted fused transcriptional regulator/phosphomethylpyrimidine kinase/predicted transcriptional regulator
LNPPCELTVRSVLPALRILVARELAGNYKWTQTRIAKNLGVTQAAVSGYLTTEVEGSTPPLSREHLLSLSKSLASEMASKKLNHTDLINYVCEICLSLRRGGAICVAHKSKITELEEEKCAICVQLHMSLSEISDARRGVLGEMRCAISLLESTPEYYEMVPQVFSNIVMGITDARGIADVAGIPGRLVKIRGKVKALMDPEFGASGHLAKLLLVTMSKNPKLRALTNIRYNKPVMDSIKKLNLKSALLKREGGIPGTEDQLLRFADRALGKDKGIQVIIDEGGFGIEPNAYIFGETASKVADRVIRISRMVSVATRKPL